MPGIGSIGSGAATGAAGGALGGPVGIAIGAGIGALGSIFSGKSQSNAAKDASRRQAQSSRYAADLEAKAAQDSLSFLREQEATRQREWEQAQQQNFGLWQQRENQLMPARRLGWGSIAQMAMPIPKSPTDRPNPGTVAALINGR
jgi:hypothetical protein